MDAIEFLQNRPALITGGLFVGLHGTLGAISLWNGNTCDAYERAKIVAGGVAFAALEHLWLSYRKRELEERTT